MKKYGNAEDNVWAKYGISLKAYLSTRVNFLTQQEMAEDIDIDQHCISRFLRKFKIRPVFRPQVYEIARR